jgi:DNA-binding NarL/FixJ family response regulator
VLLAKVYPEVPIQIANAISGELEIGGSITNGLDLIAVAARLGPDAVVLDITVPGMDGIEAAPQLQRAGCREKLVFLAVREDDGYVRAALDAGGTAYVAKAQLVSRLVSLNDLSPTGASDITGHLYHLYNKAVIEDLRRILGILTRDDVPEFQRIPTEFEGFWRLAPRTVSE